MKQHSELFHSNYSFLRIQKAKFPFFKRSRSKKDMKFPLLSEDLRICCLKVGGCPSSSCPVPVEGKIKSIDISFTFLGIVDGFFSISFYFVLFLFSFRRFLHAESNFLIFVARDVKLPIPQAPVVYTHCTYKRRLQWRFLQLMHIILKSTSN